MPLSIREASRFVIGATLIRSQAIDVSGNTGITLDHVAMAALQAGTDGEKLRFSIETLANQQSNWIRKTPPHALKTERIMQSREVEIRTFMAINEAVMATIEFSQDASGGNTQAYNALQDHYTAAFRAIDQSLGSKQDKQQLRHLLYDQSLTLSTDSKFVESALKEAEKAYLEAYMNAILSKYDIPDHNNDFNL